MWLVFCDPNDLAGMWAYQGLQARGLAPIRQISPDDLAFSLRWEHRLSATESFTHIILRDGFEIRSDAISGVLNRLGFLPPGHLLMIEPSERDYVSQELTAFYLSWLHALSCPVLNRPTPTGLAGAWRHDSEWRWLALQAGLSIMPLRMAAQPAPVTPTADYARGVMQMALIIAGDVWAPDAPAETLAGCQRLATLAQTAILGLYFDISQDDGVWRFATASSLPDLRIAGEWALSHLTAALRGERKLTT